MIAKSGRYPVDGGLECGPESKAQRFVSRVSHAARRPDGLTGGVRQLEVAVHSLETRRTTALVSVHMLQTNSCTLFPLTSALQCPEPLCVSPPTTCNPATRCLFLFLESHELMCWLTSCKTSIEVRMLGNVVCTTPNWSSEKEAWTR